ncbi:duboraya isoform X1 [Stegastes partitus]|nr:PREDICTED: capZ-interacting protein-like isoform X1 [Stegastes partitus]
MEEEAPARRSVAELAGRFKGPASPHSAAGKEVQEKPVRRRPPRTLQLPKPQGDDQEPPTGVTSPLPAKAKRNSALIEKLQANLALSPAAPSPKSPGFRLLPPTFTPPAPGSAPATAVTTLVTPTSPVTVAPATEEEGPASFEAPPTAAEGAILSSINKGRARLSIRRRPPSRRHRKSSCGDDAGGDDAGGEDVSGDVDVSTYVVVPTDIPTDVSTDVSTDVVVSTDVSADIASDTTETQPRSSEAEDKTTAGQEGPTDAPSPPDEHQTHEEDQPKSSDKVKVKEGENGEASSSSDQKDEEKEKQDSTEAETKTDDHEEQQSEEGTSSAR